MKSYYLSRAIVSAGLAACLTLLGTPLWLSAASGMLVFLVFVWMTLSGRYVTNPEFGATALRRDERTQQIVDKAARNAFVVVTLILAGLVVYFGTVEKSDVPVALLTTGLAAGAVVYILSDFWMQTG